MNDFWQHCSALLERELTPQQYVTWIKPLAPVAFDAAANTLSIAAPNLRGPSGRLDATKIARRLGVPIARLAAVVGVSRQALSQTPDSPGIQHALDAIAHTLDVLDTSLQPGDQQKWLRTSRANIDRKTPLDTIMGGGADIVARMLEGASEVEGSVAPLT